MQQPLLSEFELAQPGVQKIIDYFDKRLIADRIANDSPHADQLLRGRIAEIKDFKNALHPESKTETNARRCSM